MTLRESLENRIRGWLPKEPVFVGPRHISKAHINKETAVEPKEIAVGILDVIGLTFLGFSIYVYLVNPNGWRLAWITNVTFTVIGLIAIALTIFIWRKRKK
jgi:LPXTG-motif cell wall-anchored protein